MFNKKDRSEFYNTYDKLYKVMLSCKTMKQFNVSMAYLELARAKYPELYKKPFCDAIGLWYMDKLNEIR